MSIILFGRLSIDRGVSRLCNEQIDLKESFMNMKRSLFIVACTVMTVGCTQPVQEMSVDPNEGLYGGWIVAEWEMPETEVFGMSAEHGLFLFTESGHYSMMWVPFWDRPILPTPASEASEAQLAEAYMGFWANSGRYTVEGGTITYEAYMARSPGYMSRFEPMGGQGNARSMSYALNEDGTLTLEFVGADEYQAGVVATLRRP